MSSEQAGLSTQNLNSVVMGPRLVEATYSMTRELAMKQAQGLGQKLGHRDWDQAALVPEMTRWLSESVIKVLDEDTKNKVFMWCEKHGQNWVDVIRAAKDDLVEYRFTTNMEEQHCLDRTASSLQPQMEEMLNRFKTEILQQQRDGTAQVLERVGVLASPTPVIQREQPNRARRSGIDESSSFRITTKIQNFDEGLRLLVTEDSGLVKEFWDIVGSLNDDYTRDNMSPRSRAYYNFKRREELRSSQVRELGLTNSELDELRKTMQRTPRDSPVFGPLARFARDVTTEYQFKSAMKMAGWEDSGSELDMD
ncbi:hypothetical protein FZEAL_1172 [Fusarium zealandicum]|uniref:Uncharacterized protein n=1 Tax=Fusarium zealandicum TaxID=1053134 RepID=A0A8H4UTK1_9HYPO|nr:hypothetical protein FZEAL_1172 [Fusarium zealandicum]